MHAFLLVGRETINLEEQIAKIAAKQMAKIMPFKLEKIDDCRELNKITKFSFSEQTAIVINNIDNISIEAANAFLKNLEEPNSNLIYILTASNLDSVLPTIVSRCEIIKTPNSKLQIINKSQDTNYKNALNIKDRDVAIKFIEDFIYIDHEKSDFKNMENYLKTIKNLKANGNVSLQLTNFVVMLNR